MNRREALRLAPGTRIIFCDHQYTAKATCYWKGEVLAVTPRGGIRVRVLDEKPWRGDQPGGEERWVPYHHVVR